MIETDVFDKARDHDRAEQLEMARKGHAELLRVMAAAGYEVVQ